MIICTIRISRVTLSGFIKPFSDWDQLLVGLTHCQAVRWRSFTAPKSHLQNKCQALNKRKTVSETAMKHWFVYDVQYLGLATLTWCSCVVYSFLQTIHWLVFFQWTFPKEEHQSYTYHHVLMAFLPFHILHNISQIQYWSNKKKLGLGFFHSIITNV